MDRAVSALTELCDAAMGGGVGLGFPWICVVCEVVGSYHGERWNKQLNKCCLKEKNKFVPKWFFICFVLPQARYLIT